MGEIMFRSRYSIRRIVKRLKGVKHLQKRNALNGCEQYNIVKKVKGNRRLSSTEITAKINEKERLERYSSNNGPESMS